MSLGCASICPLGVITNRPTLRQLLKENGALKLEIDCLKRSVVKPAVASTADGQPLTHFGDRSSPSSDGLRTRHSQFSPVYSPQRFSKLPITSDSNNQTSVGQLSIESSGGSRFYGPTAAVHMLPDGENSDDGDKLAEDMTRGYASDSVRGIAFPLISHALGETSNILEEARATMPPHDELQRWCEIYWKASGWRWEPISRDYFDTMFLDIFSSAENKSSPKQASQLAVLYAILAIGCLFDEQLPNHSALAKRFNSQSLVCLSAGRFLTNPSVPAL